MHAARHTQKGRVGLRAADAAWRAGFGSAIEDGHEALCVLDVPLNGTSIGALSLVVAITSTTAVGLGISLAIPLLSLTLETRGVAPDGSA